MKCDFCGSIKNKKIFDYTRYIKNHDKEGFGYRKISQWLNKSGIKTHRGKKWFNSSVISVLKRKHEHDLRNQQIRNQHFPTKISKFEVNYYIFD